MNRGIAIVICFFLLMVNVLPAPAQIRLPAIIRDSMILQRDANVHIWGWASANEKVSLVFNKKRWSAKAGKNGYWQMVLPPVKAGGPYTMELSGKNKIVLTGVLFGDVWFCSGQSNMVHQMNIHDVRYAKDITEANYPAIRQFLVSTGTNLSGPQADVPTACWQPAVADKVRPFSAVAYFFARKLYQENHVPIGIINSSVGGTPIEAWMSEDGLKEFGGITTTLNKNKDTAFIKSMAAGNSSTGPRKTTDLGLLSEKKWYDTSYVPTGWRNINIPGYWEDQGIKDLNGVIWYRKEINVPASMTGKTAKVFMGRIVDADELYINGRLVGSTTYQYPQRRYTIAAGVLQAGKNSLVVRVSNRVGKGGFVPDKPYCIFTGSDTIDLNGEWQYKVGDVFPPPAPGSNSGGISFQNQPAALYNAMVAPLINYNIKGFCWYQGEANTGNPAEYTRLMPALIEDWRKKWKQDNLPFLYVQLPGFMDYNYLPAESNWAMLREAQSKALSVPHTAMVVAIDLGEWNDIHPDNKKTVGDRLALAAMKIADGKDIVSSGPVFQSAVVNGNRIAIDFSGTGSGMITNDNEAPGEFAVAGADKKFVWAQAKIEGNKIIVWNDNLANPLYVRYAWADDPVHPNVYNREGFPASPFRTDQ